MKTTAITPLSNELTEALQQKINLKTKPIGSLGKLETIALQIGRIQNTLTPHLSKPHIIVFAGDHGITEEKVSPFPQEVTHQMVFNFLQGGAAINVFSKQHHIALKIVDAGVNFNFEAHPNLEHAKIGYGTQNFAITPAMGITHCGAAIQKGGEYVLKAYEDGCNSIGFGEMGVGNTSAAAALMSVFTEIPITDCVGAGTGLDTNGIKHKKEVLGKAIKKHGISNNPIENLATYGGFEIAMLVGAFLKAAENQMTILVDGFIVTAALLVASKIDINVLDYCVFTHTSHEKGHQKMLTYLKATPLFDMEMRLGEGTGVAVAYPIIQSAICFLNEMASFESAGVSSEIK